MTAPLIEPGEFARVAGAPVPPMTAMSLLADMHRVNILTMVMRAGSGHLGTSLSVIDLLTWLFYQEMNRDQTLTDPDRDVYISSKGHDAPALYAVLHGLARLPASDVLQLRRLDGAPGHPDVRWPGIEANTGSLGMGLSKGVGVAIAKRQSRRDGRVWVTTGDGEWQEGQVYEALRAAAARHLDRLTVIVDHNQVQSDRLVDAIVPLGDLVAIGRSFGWHVVRCDGHSMPAIAEALQQCRAVRDQPQLVIAETVKGRGVSFMEHPEALRRDAGVYRWHAGAPDTDAYARAIAEVTGRLQVNMATAEIAPLAPVSVDLRSPTAPPSDDWVARAYGDALRAAAGRMPSILVLDGDLAADCQVRAFEHEFPDRFVECGIAEQHMVSMASGLARHGFLPVVNSFAAFLTARANEQIANQVSEGSRVIYAAHYAGLLPAAAGESHQSLRDIAALGAIPGITIVQPSCENEARMAVDYAIAEAPGSCVLRMNLGPSRRPVVLPEGYRLTPGCGVCITGTVAAPWRLVAYGPTMLTEACAAHEQLAAAGVESAVFNMPWLTEVDPTWLAELLRGAKGVIVIEDHSPVGGLADLLRRHRDRRSSTPITALGVEGRPVHGAPAEVLHAHGLDAASIARRVAAWNGRPREHRP